MSRDGGFLRADVDTGMMTDSKVKKLVRLHRDPTRTAVAVLLYQALVLESWGEGDRLTIDDAVPAWFTESADDLIADLKTVELVDSEGRIPVASWETWFKPAQDRRTRKREGGSVGGKRSWDKRNRSSPEGDLEHSRSRAEPSQPAIPSSRRRAPAREGGSANGREMKDLFDTQDLSPEEYQAAVADRLAAGFKAERKKA